VHFTFASFDVRRRRVGEIERVHPLPIITRFFGSITSVPHFVAPGYLFSLIAALVAMTAALARAMAASD
jgi:hypothetical protein